MTDSIQTEVDTSVTIMRRILSTLSLLHILTCVGLSSRTCWRFPVSWSYLLVYLLLSCLLVN